MATDTAQLLKQYCLLSRNIASLSNGQAVLRDSATEDEDALTAVHVSLSPRDGPYRGGKFDFVLDLSDGYPTSPPTVRSLTPMYHPNVEVAGSEDEEDGSVCLNLMDELWTPSMTLEDVVQGLLFLLYNPNLEDPLSCLFCGSEDEDDFLCDVRRSLRGGDVAGVHFERNLLDGYDSECDDDQEEQEGEAPVINDNLVSIDDVLGGPEGDMVSTNTAEVVSDNLMVESANKTAFSPNLDVLVEADENETLGEDSDGSSPSSPTPTLPASVPATDKWKLFSQQNPPLSGFDMMWALALSSTMRTIVLGAQRAQTLARVDSSEIDVR